MTVITWCGKKLRRAYEACQRLMCCGGGNTEMDRGHVVHVDLPMRADERNPSVPVQEAAVAVGPLSLQRLRPDIQPIGMRRFADPEKVAAVFKACKELRVPIDEDRAEEETYEDGSGPASDIRTKTARNETEKNAIDNTVPR